MASWKDGAAYAPIERPDGFATPRAAPLSSAERKPAITPGAVPHPRTIEPVDAPPLSKVGLAKPSARDAREPFEIQSAAATSMATLPDGKRDPKAPFAVTAPAQRTAVAPSPPPPPPNALPLDVEPRRASAVQHEGSIDDPGQKSLLWLMTGMCAAGVVVPVAAPFLLIFAGLLSILRVRWTSKIGAAATGVGSTLMLIALLLPAADTSVLFGLSSILFAIAFLIRAYASNSDDRPSDDQWAPQEMPWEWRDPNDPRNRG